MPNRILKESICTSLALDTLSPEAERMFYRLLTVADDFGRFQADSRILLASCFPLKIGHIDTLTVQQWYNDLEAAGLIQSYKIDQKMYGYFVSWARHQRKRAEKSKWPAPDSNGQQMSANGGQLTADDSESRSSDGQPQSDDSEKRPKANKNKDLTKLTDSRGQMTASRGQVTVNRGQMSALFEKRETRNEKRETRRARENDGQAGGLLGPSVISEHWPPEGEYLKHWLENTGIAIVMPLYPDDPDEVRRLLLDGGYWANTANQVSKLSTELVENVFRRMLTKFADQPLNKPPLESFRSTLSGYLVVQDRKEKNAVWSGKTSHTM